ncbi:MAG: hypothetical protein PHD97_04025 [Bacteroidales bacterium]|nr:hypothetical protein [Bacteroidales bacterium]
MKTELKKLAIVLIAVIGIGLTGCKKDEKTNTDSMEQLSKDQNTVQCASDEGLNDANDILEQGSRGRGYKLPCNVTLDTVVINGDTIRYTLTYDGLNCLQNVIRKGVIIVKKKISDSWKTAGAKVYVQFINFKITKHARTVTVNGMKAFENVSGGRVVDLGNGTTTSVVHRVSGYLDATFDDGTTRKWNIARQLTFTGNASTQQLILTADGFGSANGYSNLETWGDTRKGDAFYSQILTSISIKQACAWDPASGVLSISIPADDIKATITAGYDVNDKPITNGDCPAKVKLDWEKGSKTGTIYLPL